MTTDKIPAHLGGCGCQYDAAGRLFLPRCICPDRFIVGRDDDGTVRYHFPQITERRQP